MPRRAVFLDRDGIINEDLGYIDSPDRVRIIPGAGTSLRRLRDAGFLAIVATNQSGVARGLFTEDDLIGIHAALMPMLAAEGGTLDAIYYCPHLADGAVEAYKTACDCRKPAPGLLLAAARDLDISLADSVMVGDTAVDVEAGRAAGCRTILVSSSDRTRPRGADAVVPDLAAAVDLILGWDDRG